MIRPPATRERLFHLLAEAAELEHNLLCSYLFALFSLKQTTAEDLTVRELATVRRWQQRLRSVCIEEMLHLAQVANLSVAVGMRPHFNRPNLPVAAGYHPADIVVELAPFDRETVVHFVYLERPEGSEIADAPSYGADPATVERARSAGLMPAAPEYSTIGAFYAELTEELKSLCVRLGPDRVFNRSSWQLSADELKSPQLIAVGDLRSGIAAIERIVHQGEGAPGDSATSHFAHFSRTLEELDELQRTRPAFAPARAVARNPVMRPPVVAGRVHVTEPLAARTLDLGNSVYNLMLRCLVQCYEIAPNHRLRGPLINGAMSLMHVLAKVGQQLTTLPARPDRSTPTAGLTFTTLRATEGYGNNEVAAKFLVERSLELAAAIDPAALGPEAAGIKSALTELCSELIGADDTPE